MFDEIVPCKGPCACTGTCNRRQQPYYKTTPYNEQNLEDALKRIKDLEEQIERLRVLSNRLMAPMFKAQCK